MTRRDLYEEGIRRLQNENIPDFHLDAWYLLEDLLRITRTEYFMNPNEEVMPDDEKKFMDCIAKRISHVPLQHLTGRQEFMGFSFMVNENVLIPRQDTETLVEEALKERASSVLDLCTGSGCIAISIAKLMQTERVVGADISEKALEVAEANNRLLGTAVHFVKSNLFENLTERFDMIVSNPPYIKTEEIRLLMPEVRDHDPLIALDGKEDGLYFYKKIIKEAWKHLTEKGSLLLETGWDQAEDVCKLMKLQGYKNIHIIKDLCGLDRVAKCQRE